MRVLADAYVVQGTYGGRLDGSRIGDGLAALGAAEFEASLNQLATSLMRDPSATSSHLHRLSTGQEEMLSMMLGSGTYGTQSTVVRRRLEGVAGDDGNPDDLRRRYLVRRLFSSREAMGAFFPVCRWHSTLLPLFYAYRIVRGTVTKGGSIKRELEGPQLGARAFQRVMADG